MTNIYSGIPENALFTGSNPFIGDELKAQSSAGVLSLKKIDDHSVIVDSADKVSIFAKEDSGSIKLMRKNYSGTVSEIGGEGSSSPETVVFSVEYLSDLFSRNDIEEGNKAYVEDVLYRYADSGNEDYQGYLVSGIDGEYNGTYVRDNYDVGDRNYYFYNIDGDGYLVHDSRWMFVTDIEDISNTIIAKNSSTDGWSHPNASEITWVTSDDEPTNIELLAKPSAGVQNWQIDSMVNCPQDSSAYVRVNNYWMKHTIEFEGDDAPYQTGGFVGQFAVREGAIYMWTGGGWAPINLEVPI